MILAGLLLSTFAFCVEADEKHAADSWRRIRIAPETFGHFEYQNVPISLYSDSGNSQRTDPGTHKYYFSPLVRLDHQKAKCIFNNVTKRAEMHFAIEMWNEALRDKIFDHLREEENLTKLKKSRVEVLPLERVVLVSASPLPSSYTLPRTWSLYRSAGNIELYFTCDSTRSCSQLEEAMKSSPKQFGDLTLKFSLESRGEQKKQTTIQVSTVRDGELFIKLNQRFPKAQSVLVTADDKKRMLSETSQRILAETFDNDEIFGSSAQHTVMAVLENLIFTARETVEQQNSTIWKSVFWEQDNYRPDKAATTINQVYVNADQDTQERLRLLFSNSKITAEDVKRLFANQQSERVRDSGSDSEAIDTTNSQSHAANLGGGRPFFGQSPEHNYGVEKETDAPLKLLEECHQNVHWNGTRFIPKPLELFRASLAKIRSGQDFTDRVASMRYLTAMFSIKVHTDESYEPSLVNQIRGDVDQLKKTVSEQIAAVKEDQKQQIAAMKEDQEQRIAAMKEDQKQQIAAVKEDQKHQIAAVKEDQEQQIAAVKEDQEQQIAAVKEDQEQQIAAVKEDQKQEIAAVKEDQKQQIAVVRQELEGLVATIRQAQTEETAAIRDEQMQMERRLNLTVEQLQEKLNIELVGTFRGNPNFTEEAVPDSDLFRQIVGKSAEERQELLFGTAESGNVTLLRNLVLAGSDVNFKNQTDSGKTPLHRAALNGHVDAIKALVALKANVNAKDNTEDTPLHEAALNGHVDAIKALVALKADVNAKDSAGETPLHEAAWKGHVDAIEAIVALKADVNAKDNDGQTPLYYAVSSGLVDVIEALVALKADVNAKDNQGNTPLHEAAWKGHVDAIEALVALKVDVNAKDNQGNIPLHEAAWKGHVDAIEALVALKADVNAKDNQTNTPLHEAAWNGHVDAIKALVALKADVNAKDNDGETPLHYAAWKGHVDAIEALVALKADVNAGNKIGGTPLHRAAYLGHVDAIKALVALKANVNAKDNDGNTPLQIAPRWNSREAVKALLDAGANKLVRNNDSKTPKDYAREVNRPNVLDLL